jgi:hypothetical protein
MWDVCKGIGGVECVGGVVWMEASGVCVVGLCGGVVV